MTRKQKHNQAVAAECSKRNMAVTNRGPLESLTLADHCEMCGQGEVTTVAEDRYIAHPLEPAFNPSGVPMTLCYDCRIGSAELLQQRCAQEK